MEIYRFIVISGQKLDENTWSFTKTTVILIGQSAFTYLSTIQVIGSRPLHDENGCIYALNMASLELSNSVTVSVYSTYIILSSIVALLIFRKFRSLNRDKVLRSGQMEVQRILIKYSLICS
ncbi:hypothetical protein PMAYCL1PPCAC_02449 [Pristionchus mayeri]|uniref:G protein-coupled receptor n=1 Tax=Pristionchus mayeri TaxID=1317129 RepID=A0AAN5C7Y6_9BILA|nr:hypothetical protein PMAYCL1PPCAC_02449 [Pristionchus mayeri]